MLFAINKSYKIKENIYNMQNQEESWITNLAAARLKVLTGPQREKGKENNTLLENKRISHLKCQLCHIKYFKMSCFLKFREIFLTLIFLNAVKAESYRRILLLFTIAVIDTMHIYYTHTSRNNIDI